MVKVAELDAVEGKVKTAARMSAPQKSLQADGVRVAK